ncbi:MAG: hypothetical protein ACKPKO_12835, partial [Candidatus Fonsibacter sp.]
DGKLGFLCIKIRTKDVELSDSGEASQHEHQRGTKYKKSLPAHLKKQFADGATFQSDDSGCDSETLKLVVEASESPCPTARPSSAGPSIASASFSSTASF